MLNESVFKNVFFISKNKVGGTSFEDEAGDIYIEPTLRVDYEKNNTIAVGNPCRVIREITQEDKAFWEDKYAAYWTEIANEQNTTIKEEASK